MGGFAAMHGHSFAITEHRPSARAYANIAHLLRFHLAALQYDALPETVAASARDDGTQHALPA